MSERVIMIGGGAFAREIMDWAWDRRQRDGYPEFTHVLDKEPDPFAGFPDIRLEHLGDPADHEPRDGDRFVIAIGDPGAKRAILSALASKGAQFLQLIHPTAVVSRTARLGQGVVVGPHAYIAANAAVGDFCSVNSLTGIGHDATLGDFSTISSQVDVTGGVTIGSGTFVGSGARILPRLKIGENARIGAGSVVVRGIKADRSVFAQPARSI